MDTHDVSEIPQYFELLRKQKKNLQDAQLLKGQRPKANKRRDELIMQFKFRLMMKQTTSKTMNYNIRTTFIPPAYTPCVTSLSDLKKVMIKDLRLETHHSGTYLLLRSVTPPDRLTAIMAIVEDENNDVSMLQLYYQPEESERSAEQILPEGAVVIVKEPYLKVMADGDYGLRVDHLSDVSFDVPNTIPNQWQLKATTQNIPAATSKLRGNQSFNNSRYFEAIEHYSQGILHSEIKEEANTLKLNRSLAFLRTNQFDAALTDLENASSTTKPNEKALFRKGQALYNLRRYRECAETFKLLCLEHPSDAAKAELNRTISRLNEQETGVYMFKQLNKEATKLRPPHLDHATHVGKVEIRTSQSRGRGLFTTSAVQAGDLLLCEKAFAHAFYDSTEDDDGQVALLVIPETDSMSMGTQGELIAAIIRKMQRNPSLSSVITDLHHGLYKPVSVSEVDGTAIVDSFLVQSVVSLNCFGCPLLSRESYVESMNEEEINKGKKHNGFHSCGIWPKASYINHSCYSNARRSFIGDMMMIRATQNLEPDTEITFWYHPPLIDGYSAGQKNFRNWNFKCDCPMCQDDKQTNDTIITKRKSLRAGIARILNSGKLPDIDKLEKLFSALAETYTQPAPKVPRLSLWDPLYAMSQMYLHHKQPTKAIDAALRCLASLGYVIEGGKKAPLVVKKWGLMEDGLVKCWMTVAVAYHMLKQEACRIQAYEYAKTSYRICVGEDETFDEVHGKLSDMTLVC